MFVAVHFCYLKVVFVSVHLESNHEVTDYIFNLRTSEYALFLHFQSKMLLLVLM